MALAVDYLIVAGGGGGGGAGNGRGGGGGGGGGVLTGSDSLSPGTFPVVVGDGGIAGTGTGDGGDGGNSSFNSHTAIGGGGGGWGADSGSNAGHNGGSGGGGGSLGSAGGGTGTVGQGHNGGSGLSSAAGGGGGGAGSAGGNGGGSSAGPGGDGISSSISGSAVYYGGGGGGGRTSVSSGASGGLGGGGTGGAGNGTRNGGDGTDGLGGGGGGGAYNGGGSDKQPGGKGGKGVVIIRYLTSALSGYIVTGGTITTSGSYTIHTFTTNANFVVQLIELTVSSSPVNNITDTTARGNGTIDTEASAATERGFVYDTASQSDPGNVAPGSSGYANEVHDSGSFGTGSFNKDMTGLDPFTTYYVRAYAYDGTKYAYGEEVSFTTLKPPAPSVLSVDPGGSQTGVTTSITITGSNFEDGDTVTIDGDECDNVVVVDEYTITCDAPVREVGMVAVLTVEDPYDQSSSTTFSYVKGVPNPEQPAPIEATFAVEATPYVQ